MENEKKYTVKVHMDDLVPIIKEHLAQGQSVTFSPKGISMLPMLRQGKDTVTLSPIVGKLKKYDLPLYQRQDGKYVLHRIVKVKDGFFTMAGDNQYTYENGIENRQIIAVVTSFTRDGKVHLTNETGYLLYCRLWHYSRFMRRCLRALKFRLTRLFKIDGKK